MGLRPCTTDCMGGEGRATTEEQAGQYNCPIGPYLLPFDNIIFHQYIYTSFSISYIEYYVYIYTYMYIYELIVVATLAKFPQTSFSYRGSHGAVKGPLLTLSDLTSSRAQ